MANDELIGQALRAASSKSKAPGKAKKAKPGASAAVLQGALNTPIKPVTIKDEGDQWWETPVVKSILDTISTGVYAVGNYADFATAGDEKKKEIVREAAEAFKKGDNIGGALDLIGSIGGIGPSVGAGLMKGVSGGIGGNSSDASTFANAVTNLQRNAGIDTESEESKRVQGIAGFAGDVLFDPANVVGLGVPVKAVRGAQIGAKQFKEAQAFSKATGKAMPEYIAPTKWDNAKKVAGEEINKYRKAEYDAQQARMAVKEMKKKGTSDAKKADFLIENVQTLRPAVYRSLVKTMDDPKVLVDRVVEKGNTDDILESLTKMDEGIPDEIMDPKDIVPNTAPHLGQIKPLTMEQKLADEVGKMRTTNKKPLYSPEVAANVAKLREVKAKPTKKDYETLGILPKHLPLMQAGTKVENIMDEISSGDIRHITRDIRRGIIPEKALAGLYDITGTKDPTEIARFIDTAVKTEPFKQAAKELGRYGTHRTGETPLPYIGVSGHGKLSVAGKGYTPADNLSARYAANPEDARKFLEANYQFHATELARNPRGAELRVLADNIFHKVVGEQRTEAGPLTSPRGASLNEAKTKAKWETRWNTHSNIFRISEVTKSLKAMNFKRGGEYDTAWMQVLSDVDNRLRLAGIDPHLSNMKLMDDKLVVRLAPSDVFGAMTQTDRIKYIHGNLRHSGKSITEFMPSTILDLAEVMVRSATKLTPGGEIDVETLLVNAIATLNGRYAKFMPEGKVREIGKNLDVFSYNKANLEILTAIDRKIGTDYAKQFKSTDSQLDKIRLMEVVKKSDPEDFKKFSIERMQEVPKQLFAKFTKGMTRTGSESNMLTHLINTNMRNASVFGGSVSREIGEASAEYTAKVLDALNNGSAGDFLSELVIRPPFSSSDAVARAVISENQKLVQRSVATEGEIKAAYALNRNVNGTGSSAANNGAAFQKSDEIAGELSKPIEQINRENLFDLTLRELNKDMLYRIYGPHRFFNRRAGMRTSFDEVVGSAHASSLIMTGMHGIIRNWRARGITSEQLRVALQTLKMPEAEMTPLATELQDVMRTLFDPSRNNFLTRNTVGPAHFNRILENVGFDPEKFKVDPNATPEEMSTVWMTWDITNVEDFISKLTGAMVKTAEDVSVGSAITSKFGSPTPQKGYVKLTDSKGKNPLFPLIDQNLYYPEELANEFVHIGRLMTEARSFKPGTGLHTFVTKVMDPVISALKMTQTTLKPGHHIMSIIGDMWRNSLALSQLGVVDPRKQLNLYFESMRILRANVGEIDELSEFGKFQRLQGVTTDIKIRNDGTGSEYYANIGSGGRITRTKLYELMQAKGVALPAHLGGMAEDFLTQFDELDSLGKKTGNMAIDTIGRVTSGLDRLANPLKPKFGMDRPYSLNAFTANRDTWTRGVIFLGAMRSKKFRSVEEAAEFAANEVKKWAPTALDMGAMESKVARRIIFYYTWIRGMVPRIIESALMTPGIVTIPNKLMYNVAVSNGIDPSSIGDPFPEGTLFPSWYTERVIGPQYEVDGNLWGANPTGPLGDVLNSLGSNVKPKDFLGPEAFTKTAGTFLNMSTPFFKAPWELTTGRTIETGAPIADKAQYVQDMVGPARVLSKSIGKDLYPAFGEDGAVLPNRTEKKFARGMTGEETVQNAMPELLNWASGLNFTNYTSDSARNSAYYQKRDERTQERKLQERLGE